MAEFTKRRGDTWVFDLVFTRYDQQKITIEGSPASGTWTATYESQDKRTFTTIPIAHNAAPGVVQAAFELLPNVEPGDVSVSGGPGPTLPWIIASVASGSRITAVTSNLQNVAGVSLSLTNQPFNLTGGKIYATFKTNVSQADAATGAFQYFWISGGSSSGITVTTPANGRAVLTVADSDTATYEVTKYVYDVQVTDALGQTYTPDDGSVTVLADVTRITP